MSIKTDLKPTSIHFLNKDLGQNTYHTTRLSFFDKKAYYYNMYVQIADIWQRQKAIKTAKSSPKDYLNPSNRSTESTINDQPQIMECQTIGHNVFPIKNSKKAIFRLKINKNVQKNNRLRQDHQYEAIIDDLNINRKLIAARQQKSAIKMQQASIRHQHSHNFYLNRKIRPISGSMDQDISTLYNINQITPW